MQNHKETWFEGVVKQYESFQLFENAEKEKRTINICYSNTFSLSVSLTICSEDKLSINAPSRLTICCRASYMETHFALFVSNLSWNICLICTRTIALSSVRATLHSNHNFLNRRPTSSHVSFIATKLFSWKFSERAKRREVIIYLKAGRKGEF